MLVSECCERITRSLADYLLKAFGQFLIVEFPVFETFDQPDFIEHGWAAFFVELSPLPVRAYLTRDRWR